MNKKEKKTYAFLLSLRLAQMLKANEKEAERFNEVVYKHSFTRTKLSNDEQQIYFRAGVKYPKSAINRIRIELNNVLIEMDKEHVL